jgi:hypothetical protein
MVKYLNPPYTVTRKLLWWQKRGLQQTATGYGSKLTTAYMLTAPGDRPRRVYAICYSNVASYYVLVKCEVLYLRDGDLSEALERRN